MRTYDDTILGTLEKAPYGQPYVQTVVSGFNLSPSAGSATAVTVGTSTSTSPLYPPWNDRAFYSATRYWVCYHDGTNAVYRSSTDGSSWSDATTFFSSVTFYQFDTHYDGTYFHYVGADGIWLGPTGAIYYRRGVPQSDGTITWSAAEQTVIAADTIALKPLIVVDSDGYPIIGFHEDAAGDNSNNPMVTYSSTNDGTWATAGGFPYKLSTTECLGIWGIGIAPLTGQKFYCTYVNAISQVLGKAYDSGWGSEDTVTAHNSHGDPSVISKDDEVHVLYVWHSNGDHMVTHVYRSSSGVWQSETNVYNTLTGTNLARALCRSGDNVLCFYAVLAFRPFANGSLGDTVEAFSGDLNLQTQTLNVSSVDHGGQVSCCWFTSDNPKNVRFAVFSASTTFANKGIENRILAVTQFESAWVDGAEIILNNHDKYFSDKDLEGAKLVLGFGFMAVYDNVPDLYVEHQEDISIGGHLMTRLICMGNWGRLKKHKIMGNTIAAAYYDDDGTVKVVINYALALVSMGTVTVDSSDGTEDTVVPQITYEVDESLRRVIGTSNSLTTNLLKMQGTGLRMIERDDSAASDYDYNLLEGHAFWSLRYTQSMLEANRIIVVDSMPDSDGTTQDWIGQADDTVDQTLFGITTLTVLRPYVGSNAEAKAAADALLSQIQRNAVSGVLLAPMNCGQEMHDLIAITDQREGWTDKKVRVGGITRRFKPGTFEIELTFGGLLWESPEPIDIPELVYFYPKPAPPWEGIEGPRDDRQDVEPIRPSIYPTSSITWLTRQNPWNMAMEMATGTFRFRDMAVGNIIESFAEEGLGPQGAGGIRFDPSQNVDWEPSDITNMLERQWGEMHPGESSPFGKDAPDIAGSGGDTDDDLAGGGDWLGESGKWGKWV